MTYQYDENEERDIKLISHTKKGWLTYDDNNFVWDLYLRVGTKYANNNLVECHCLIAANMYKYEVEIEYDEIEELHRQRCMYEHPLVQEISQRIVTKHLL